RGALEHPQRLVDVVVANQYLQEIFPSCVVERASVESCFGQSDWPEVVFIRATSSSAAHSNTSPMSHRKRSRCPLRLQSRADRWPTCVTSPARATRWRMQYHHAPVQRELPHVYFKISISPRQFRHCVALSAMLVSWRGVA